MSVRATVVALVVGVGAALGILYLAGGFTARISAARTAAILKRGESSWRSVRCKPYSGRDSSYWDYTCRVDSRRAAPFSFEVRVNGSGITDQSGP